MNILTKEEVALLTSTSAELLAYSKHLEDDRESKQKRSFDLSREKMRSGSKLPQEELYKTLKELKPATQQLLKNRLSGIEGKIASSLVLEAVTEFVGLQSFVYDGFKAALPTDRALIFPPDLGQFMCDLLEQHRKLFFDLKGLLESSADLPESVLPKLLSIFPLNKTKEIFQRRVETDLAYTQTMLRNEDVPGILQRFLGVIQRQKPILTFTLLGEGALELWQCFDSFLAQTLSPVLETLDFPGFSSACSAIKYALNGLQATADTSGPSITRINVLRAFEKTKELMDTIAMSHQVDLVDFVETGAAVFLAESAFEVPDYKTVFQGGDVDIDQAEALIESLDNVPTCLKPVIDPLDISIESEGEEEPLNLPSSTKNPDLIIQNPTKLLFPRHSSSPLSRKIKISGKSVVSMTQFMKENQMALVNRLSRGGVEWDKQLFAVLNSEEIVFQVFKLEDVVVKQARVLHGNVFPWPKRTSTALKRFVETIDKVSLMASGNEVLLRSLCTTLTTQISDIVSLLEGEKQHILYSHYPAQAIALVMCDLQVLRIRQEQLYTLLRMSAKQMLPEEAYILSHLKQQRTLSALFQLLDSKLQSEVDLMMLGVDAELWSDQKIRYTSKGTDQPSYGLLASQKVVRHLSQLLEKSFHKEWYAITTARMIRHWAKNVALKYCSAVRPSRVRLAQYLKDLDWIHIALLDEFQRFLDVLPGLGDDTEVVCWEVFLGLKTLWQVIHVLFLTGHLIRLPHSELLRLLTILQETNSMQPELTEKDWPLPSVLLDCIPNTGQELRLHIRGTSDTPLSEEKPEPQSSSSPSSYFADVISREFNSAFALFMKTRLKYPGKYTVFHFLTLFCLASSNSMKEQLEKSLPIMFQNKAKAYRSYEELVLSDKNLSDFFIFPASKLISVLKLRPEMTDDEYPPLTEEQMRNRKELAHVLGQVHSVESRQESVDESAVQSPT